MHPYKYGPENDFATELTKLVDNGYRFKYVVNAKGKMDKLKKYTLIKSFKEYKKRSVFADVPTEKCIEWATTMPEDGKKVLRSFLLCKMEK